MQNGSSPEIIDLGSMEWNSNEHFHTYPRIVFDIKISLVANKGFDCNLIAFSSCNMEGSPLIEKKKNEKKKNIIIEVYMSHFNLCQNLTHYRLSEG